MKILETPFQNCSRIYNEANLSKIFPEKQFQHSPSNSYNPQTNIKEEPLKNQTQGFQGQHGKERKSHTFKSHSPQPDFLSDQSKTHNKTNTVSGFVANNFIQTSHSSENLQQEKEYGSVGNQKASTFKTNNINNSPKPTQFKKKASVNLFEEEEKSTQKMSDEKNNKKDGDNLMVFSPTTFENSLKKDKAAAGWMDQDQFKLDEDLVGQLSGEQIAEMKKQFVNQKVENKVRETKNCLK